MRRAAVQQNLPKLPHMWRSVRHAVTAMAVAGILLAMPHSVSAQTKPGSESDPFDLENDAADPREKLESLRRKLRDDRQKQQQLDSEAAQLSAEMQRLQAALIDAAIGVRQRETELTLVESELARLESEEAQASQRLAARREKLGGLLAILQRIGHEPPPALIVQPANAADAARSAMLLSAVVPAMRLEAVQLAEELNQLRQLRQAAASKRIALAGAAQALSKEHARTEALLNDKKAMAQKTDLDRSQTEKVVAGLASEAADLNSLISKLGGLARAPGNGEAGFTTMLGAAGSFAGRKGQLHLPANGVVATRFGENRVGKHAATGLSLKTRGQAQVTSPIDAKVAYAGQFLGYGQVLILVAGDGYHLVLSGLSRIDAAAGQAVLAGEPIGQMGAGSAQSAPMLTIEFWREGKPVDPAPWFADVNGQIGSKGQG